MNIIFVDTFCNSNCIIKLIAISNVIYIYVVKFVVTDLEPEHSREIQLYTPDKPTYNTVGELDDYFPKHEDISLENPILGRFARSESVN
jgi:hypothetical protein